MLRENLRVPPSKVEKSRNKIYLKMKKNGLFRVIKYQPAHAPLITELCGESLIIFLEGDLSLFHVSIIVSCLFCVFCVEYFRLPHTHSCSTCIIN